MEITNIRAYNNIVSVETDDGRIMDLENLIDKYDQLFRDNVELASAYENLKVDYILRGIEILGESQMPKISDCYFNDKKKTTTLKFSDGTVTTCKETEPLDSRYVGFILCYMKKICERFKLQNILTQADYWINDKSEKERKAKEESERRKKEESELEKRKAEKARKRRIRKMAREIARGRKDDEEYNEALKLTEEMKGE